MDPTTVMLLYTAARNETKVKIVDPFLREHPMDGVSITDRCWASTMVLQVVDGVDLNYTIDVQKPYMTGYPDKIFYIDLHPEESIVRVAGAKREGLEADWRDEVDMEIFIKNRERYLNLIQEFPDRFMVLDGFCNIKEQIFRLGKEILKEIAPDELNYFTRENLGVYLDNLKKEGILDLDEITLRTESAREKLGARPSAVLRQEMMASWIERGFIEGQKRRKES